MDVGTYGRRQQEPSIQVAGSGHLNWLDDHRAHPRGSSCLVRPSAHQTPVRQSSSLNNLAEKKRHATGKAPPQARWLHEERNQNTHEPLLVYLQQKY